MNKTQKTVLVTAAIACLVAGAFANTKTTDKNSSQNLAGKQAADQTTVRNACNGCPHTNKVTLNN